MAQQLLLLNGPNLNLLGSREPAVYGSGTLADIESAAKAQAEAAGATLSCFQSNHEGALIDRIHAARAEGVDFIVINPGGLTQYSVSLHDCIKAMPFPVIEVHLSNLATREEWRHHSIISPAVKGTVQGLGWRSYTAALRTLVETVREPKKPS